MHFELSYDKFGSHHENVCFELARYSRKLEVRATARTRRDRAAARRAARRARPHSILGSVVESEW